ncbi:hypothetical protein CWI75_02405 [Kineobactrum sediminis]|uniref:Uncharacterized protein n=1 Tax=Kineobactrum sediminis TaxID=1905677 RepID=A0A2N5Y757_9GAMM|nr:ABC transporter substrate-binding protein [Kineobactrum sediminis]PLW84217.1 hypothetical protein CWI75_02405 [Kineobactrum sediminis]
MVAVEQNSFRRHGLDIEVNRSATGKETLQALRAGEADFALMSITPLVC